MKKYLFSSFLLLLLLLFYNTFSTSAATLSVDELEPYKPEDGIYTIACSGQTSMVLGPQYDTPEDGTNIQVCSINNSSLQHFAINEEYDGWYTIKNIQAQYNLDVANGSAEPHANLQQWVAHVHDAQRFRFFKADNQNVFIQSKLGTFIDLADEGTTEGTNIQLYSFNGASSQKWQLIPVSQKLTTIDIPTGNYSICLDSNKHLTLDIANSSKIAGSNLMLNNSTQSKSHIYKIEQQSDGWYTIKNTYSNLYLDIKSADQTTSSTLRQWMGSGADSQKFKFYTSESNSIVIKSKYELVLTATSNTSTKNNDVCLSLYENSSLQNWLLKSCS